MEKKCIGLIGLGVMGQNLALNMERNGFSLLVYNRTAQKTKDFVEREGVKDKNIEASYSLKDMVEKLIRPRKIFIMVKAGGAVDSVIKELSTFLEEGDIIIDAGNSHYLDTERRYKDLKKIGIDLLGVGVSGGGEGALLGPCVMPGGDRNVYEEVKDILIKISAKVLVIPSCTYIGPRGSGHFLKMVHNGIEYALMQLIAETYDFLKRSMFLKNYEISDIFEDWNRGDLGSYLLEITIDILRTIDPDTGGSLLDMILDEAHQKGTGKWVSQVALDLGVPLSVIDNAVSSRFLSSFKKERLQASKLMFGPSISFKGDRDTVLKAMEDTLFCSMITAFGQGMNLLTEASKVYQYNFNHVDIAQIWRGGCIIRANILRIIKKSYEDNLNLPFIYADHEIIEIFNKRQGNWRLRVIESVFSGVPCPVTAAALNFYDSYRSSCLPANLIQAQRDYFGAHTYKRIDKEGSFTTPWKDLK